MKIWIILLVLCCAMLGGTGQVLMKKGMNELAMKIGFNWSVLFGVGLYGFAFVLYLSLLRFENVSRLYPIISLSYIFVMILSSLILKEQVTAQMFLGSFVIVGGVTLIATA